MAINDFIDKFGGWTESYFFYGGKVELRYDPKDHVYLLVTNKGLEKVDGVTTVVHVIDKSEALVPWGCKMMYQKILRTVPTHEIENVSTVCPPECDAPMRRVERYVAPMTFEEFDKLIHEAKNAHTEKLEEAGEVGHVAHAWIEEYIKLKIAFDAEADHTNRAVIDTKIEVHLANLPYIEVKDKEGNYVATDNRPANCCKAALKWMREHNVRWHLTERKIYSKKYKYAGTMDGLCTCDSCDDPKCCPVAFKDKLTVADWKTSNYLYLEYLYQTAAYMQAYNEEQYDKDYSVPIATDRWVIRLGKEDGEFEPWHCDSSTTENDTQGFLDCLDLVRRVRGTQSRIAERKADLRAALKAERDAAREAQEALERVQREEARAKKKQERLEALKLACPASKRYKGTRKPSCTTGEGGEPCVSCAFRYAKAQEGRAAKPKKKSGIGAFPHKAGMEDECQLVDGIKTVVKKSAKLINESANDLTALLVRKEHLPILLPSTTASIPPRRTDAYDYRSTLGQLLLGNGD